MQQVEIQGITRNDIQEIFQKALEEFKQSKTRIIYLDASYLYTFDLADFDIIKKFNILGRYDINAVLEWHRCLERWHSDQIVTLGSKVIKPIKIVRSFDRVVNEGLEILAQAVIGSEGSNFPWRAIGEGVNPAALPSDKTLADEVDRINVFTNPEGGSLSRDGSTIYSIGNHSKSVASATLTECGMFSRSAPTLANEFMLDHSVFASSVSHVQDSDAFGSTTVIYMCSA